MSYVKLHQSILDSTVWAEPHATRIVWITMLAMADRDGMIFARAPGIASRARVTREECETALRCFRSPDPDSRTTEHEGRRVEDTPDGIRILNYEAHRERMSAEERARKHADRQARYRARKAARDASPSTGDSRVTHRDIALRDVTEVTIRRADADADAERERADAAEARATWSQVLRLVNEATGTLHNPSPRNRQACETIAANQTRETITAAALAMGRDGWARAHGAGPQHFAEHFARYLAASRMPAPPDVAVTPGRAARDALRAQRDATTDPAERARLTAAIQESQRADGMGAQ